MVELRLEIYKTFMLKNFLNQVVRNKYKKRFTHSKRKFIFDASPDEFATFFVPVGTPQSDFACTQERKPVIESNLKNPPY